MTKRSSITVGADVAGKIMVSATGSAADRVATAAAAALAFIGIAAGVGIYRAALASARPKAILPAASPRA